MNYRVGPFGFLSLHGFREYSGNMALKDQAIALRWIYENIEKFGGAKENITLFGHSSGQSCYEFYFIFKNASFQNIFE